MRAGGEPSCGRSEDRAGFLEPSQAPGVGYFSTLRRTAECLGLSWRSHPWTGPSHIKLAVELGSQYLDHCRAILPAGSCTGTAAGRQGRSARFGRGTSSHGCRPPRLRSLPGGPPLRPRPRPQPQPHGLPTTSPERAPRPVSRSGIRRRSWPSPGRRSSGAASRSWT